MSKIIASSEYLELAARVSKLTNFELIKKVTRIFPDKEVYIRLKKYDFDQEKVFIIHSLYPNQNENLVRLLLTIDLVKDYNGLPYLVLPYLAYARQDKRFQAGEAHSLKTVAKLFKTLEVEFLLTLDVHFHRKPETFDFFGIPAKNITAVSLLIEHAKKLLGKEFLIVGPDPGSEDILSCLKQKTIFLEKEKYCPRCKEPATECKCKTKVKEYEIRTKAPAGLKNKNILVIDDMITTGGTMIQAVKVLKPLANKIAVGCTHGLFLGNSLSELKKLADYVFATDTIASEVSKISVAELIAKEIRKL